MSDLFSPWESIPPDATWQDDMLIPPISFQRQPPPPATLNEAVADEAWISAYARKVVAAITTPYVSPDQTETWELVNERLNDGC